MKPIHILIISASIAAIASTGNAQTASAAGTGHAAHDADTATTAPDSQGEVRKVDMEQGKVTIRHGPLTNLDMPAMTMVFRAADPKLLNGLKVGDKVRFTAERLNGSFTVTSIQRAQ